ncbi:MAG: DNA translocase FtsK [Patescibacteria group bacterium]
MYNKYIKFETKFCSQKQSSFWKGEDAEKDLRTYLMAKKSEQREKRERKNSEGEVAPIPARLSEPARQAIGAVGSFVVALFLLLASYGKAGLAGGITYEYLGLLFGAGYFILPLVALLFGGSYLQKNTEHLFGNALLGSALAFIGGLGVVEILFIGKGGVVGAFIAGVLVKLLGIQVGLTLSSALIVVAILIMFESKLSLEWSLFGKKIGVANDAGDSLQDELPLTSSDDDMAFLARAREEKRAKEEAERGGIEARAKKQPLNIKTGEVIEEGSEAGISLGTKSGGAYTPPPLSLLEKDSGKAQVGDIKANANIIKRTLANFGIDVEMDEISIGPSVTRYALKPAEGVKLSRISALQDNLALALAAPSLRIEAPIPGKSLVGIEVPNHTKTTVGLGTLLSSREFQDSPHPLFIALGKGLSGSAHFANLAKAPHMLIAGATGSGKSVTIQSIIVSLIYRNSPDALRFIMVDPKRVELTLYNGIPHLLTPVITDAKKAILALKWAAKEMERRYGILEACAVRDIQSYHKNVNAEPMPYIVVVIDELADIMSSYPRELEAGIVRLAQMSRAVGIHLILSTQRPSVEVITGLIKANIPSRIALQVPSQIDSRTIIDMPGAEKLLGQGDMLYLGGDMAKPGRIQSTYISENEVKGVAKFIREHSYEIPPSEINLTGENGKTDALFSATIDGTAMDDEPDDDLYEEARELVVASGKASTSYLQRRLKVGYARAARLIDILEEKGVVGPGDGAKPRDVYGAKEPAAFGDANESNLPDDTL